MFATISELLGSTECMIVSIGAKDRIIVDHKSSFENYTEMKTGRVHLDK